MSARTIGGNKKKENQVATEKDYTSKPLSNQRIVKLNNNCNVNLQGIE